MKLHNDLCYTVFSAPRYCGSCTNKGAILHFSHPDNTEPQVVQFDGHHYRPARRARAACKALFAVKFTKRPGIKVKGVGVKRSPKKSTVV